MILTTCFKTVKTILLIFYWEDVFKSIPIQLIGYEIQPSFFIYILLYLQIYIFKIILYLQIKISSTDKQHTHDVNNCRGLWVTQWEGDHLANIGANIFKTHSFQHNRGILYWWVEKMDTVYVLFRYGDTELWIEYGHCDRTHGQDAFLGGLCQAEVGTDIHPAAQHGILTKHNLNMLWNHNLVATSAYSDTQNKWSMKINNLESNSH